MTVAELITRLEAMPPYRTVGLSWCITHDHDCDGACDMLELVDIEDLGFAVQIVPGP